MALALSVADWVEPTAPTVAVKLAEVAFAGTAREAGTETAELELIRFTLKPPKGATDDSVTLQVSEPAPV